MSIKLDFMNDDIFNKDKTVAAQLRKPSGQYAKEVGIKMNEGNESMNLSCIDVVNPVDGDYILEIGMGNGKFVSKILSRGNSISYTGLDYSREMIEESLVKNKPYVNRRMANFLYGTIENLPFEEHSFNKIFSINTIYFWKDVDEILKSLLDILTPGGQLYISFRPKYILDQWSFTDHNFDKYSTDQVQILFEKAGFQKVRAYIKDEKPFQYKGGQTKLRNVVVTGTKEIPYVPEIW